jgi:hypothetical protein
METIPTAKPALGRLPNPPFLDDEKPDEEWLDRLDSVLTRLYTERGSSGLRWPRAEIGDSMDWRVDACARDANRG